jgi:hypothetical protein
MQMKNMLLVLVLNYGKKNNKNLYPIKEYFIKSIIMVINKMVSCGGLN